MIFLDANAFIAYHNERDVHHQKAIDLWHKIESEKLFTSDYVFNEVIGVILRNLGKAKAVEVGQNIIASIPIFDVDNHALAEAWRIFSEINSTLNLVDCTNLVIMKLAGSNRIATFDKEFEKIKSINVV